MIPADESSPTSPAAIGQRRVASRLRTSRRWRLVAVLAALPAIVFAAGKKPKKTDGPYTITVGGSCVGGGRATVKKDTITVSADVEDRAGIKGTLVVELTVDGDHFQGDGTVLGQPANFFGRLDGYDGDKHFKGARLLCSYTDAKGRSGRLAGPLD